MKNIFWMIFGSFFFVGFSIYAQTPARTPSPAEITRETIERKQLPIPRNLDGVLNTNTNDSRGIRPQRTRNILLTKRDKTLTSVDSRDKSKYSTFLKNSDTGIFRLHDAVNCDEEGETIHADEPCPWNIVGKATLYSFRTENYSHRIFSDMQFEDRIFKIVGLNSLGFLTDLGSVSIENLNLQSKGIKEMAEFEPSTDLEEIKKHFGLTKNGFQIGEHIYKTESQMDPDKTYALRSIAYESKVFWKIGKRKTNLLASDKRKDIVVVFRVIRENDDGSVNILWRKLQSKDAPKIETKD